MEVDGNEAEDLSHALKRLLVKHEKNPRKFFQDWEVFTEKHGRKPQCVPFIDEEAIKLLSSYIQYTKWESKEFATILQIIRYVFLHYEALKQTLDNVADQIFKLFPLLASIVMDEVTSQENLGLQGPMRTFKALVVLLQGICNSSDLYTKRYVISGSLQWTLSTFILNDAILPNCDSLVIGFLDISSEFSEEIRVTLILTHGLSLAQAICSSPSVVLRFRLTRLLRKLVSRVPHKLLLKKAEEWFPGNSKAFVGVNTFQDMLTFAYSFKNSQVSSYACKGVSGQHLDHQYFLTPPLGFQKMWVDFDMKLKYLGFFCKPIHRKGVQVSEDLSAVFYIIIPESVVERADIELVKVHASDQELRLTLRLRKELVELTDATVDPIRHSKILMITFEYETSIVEIIKSVFPNVNIASKSLRTAFSQPVDQSETPRSVICSGQLDFSDCSLKQATMSTNQNVSASDQTTSYVCTSFSEMLVHSPQAFTESAQRNGQLPDTVIGEEDMQPTGVKETEPQVVHEDGDQAFAVSEEKEDNPFWYLEVALPSKPLQLNKPLNKKRSSKNGNQSRKVPANDDGQTQVKLNGVEKMLLEFARKEESKDEFNRKVEAIHAQMTDLCMQTGGYRWKEALREELAKTKKKGGPLVASFRQICRSIDQLDMDSWKRANMQSKSDHVELMMAYLEEFANIRRDGVEISLIIQNA